jgi:hypothetical protein
LIRSPIAMAQFLREPRYSQNLLIHAFFILH